MKRTDDDDCFNCIKNDVCVKFIRNKVPKGKFIGCNQWYGKERTRNE